MSDTPPHPGGSPPAPDMDLRSVIVWFGATEQMLIDVLDVIPFEESLERVWSPRLVTVLLEACSQLDSLLKQQLRKSLNISGKNVDIVNYFIHFGQHLSEKWVLFWGLSAKKIEPFLAWRGLTRYERESYNGHSLGWWRAYTDVKHNRIEHRQKATLRHSVEALGALFLAILYCEICRDTLAASGWVRSKFPNAKACLDDHLKPYPDTRIVVESKLFSYPVGWMNRPIPPGFQWSGGGSDRFNHWFDSQAE